MKKCVVFAPIAEREIRFYAEFADHARQQNWPIEVQFISFFQNGNAYLRNKGYQVWDIYDWVYQNSLFKSQFHDLEKDFGLPNLHKLILHEKLTFGISDNSLLYDKYYRYLNGLDLIINEVLRKYKSDEVHVFQELGGFIAPLSLLFCCQKHKIEHTFFEPSFFKGTMNFINNSFISSFKGLSQITDPTESGAVDYLKSVQQSRSLVIPQKDQHHYKDMGLAKLLSFQNFVKLYNKLYVKYVKKEKQEYEWISNHVWRTIQQFINRRLTGRLYTREIPFEKFIYFPFHVRLDVQLTIRNPEYLNQLAFLEFVAQVLPRGYKVVVKEHPASIGGFNPAELKRILKENDNIVLLYPMINTYDVLDRAEAVITINSKVGAEAVTMGKPVACMGHGFYWNSEVVYKFSSNVELLKWLEDLAQGRVKPKTQQEIEKYFSEIYRQSYAFELYNHDQSNLNGFFRVMHTVLDLK